MSLLKEKSIGARALKEEEASKMPSPEEARANLENLFRGLQASHLQSFLQRLHALAVKPPQVLLIEGASEELRYAIAIYYACLLNCIENSNPINGPCCNCRSCLEIANALTADLFIFDGTDGSIKIDSIRELIPIIANVPSFLKHRIVLFHEAISFTKSSANSLLKTLEEPNKTTHFIMNVSNRERLYQTLVSRSVIFTLPTELHKKYSNEELEMLTALNTFFREGKAWFENYTSKKTFTIAQARLVINLLMSSISLSYVKQEPANGHAFIDYLAMKLNAEKTNTLIQFIDESSESIEQSTSPKIDLIIDTLLVQAYMLLNES